SYSLPAVSNPIWLPNWTMLLISMEAELLVGLGLARIRTLHLRIFERESDIETSSACGEGSASNEGE
ncbi:hypothetical protein Tco_0035505, partial [Tanacetum coccineum]